MEEIIILNHQMSNISSCSLLGNHKKSGETTWACLHLAHHFVAV